MTLPRRRMTLAEFRTLPDDGQRYELLKGELFVTPAPSGRHQRISTALVGHLWTFTTTHQVGMLISAPVDLRFSPEDSVQPDILFIRRERLSIYDEHEGVVGVPDLLIEILSPSNPEHDLVKEREMYSRYGVPEYWIVDPVAETIHVLTQQGEGLDLWQQFGGSDQLTSPMLPGLRLDLAAVFGYGLH